MTEQSTTEQTMTQANDKFLVTVNAESREVVRVEQMGEAGELIEVSTSVLAQASRKGSGASGAPEKHAAAGTPPSYAINIFMGGAQGVGDAPSLTTTASSQDAPSRATSADAVDEPPMVIPSPGVIPSAGNLSVSGTDNEGPEESVQG